MRILFMCINNKTQGIANVKDKTNFNFEYSERLNSIIYNI